MSVEENEFNANNGDMDTVDSFQRSLNESNQLPHEQHAVVENINKIHTLVCAGCGQIITDMTFLQMSGQSWHTGCLTCNVCSVSLQHEPSCYSKDGLVFCREDYYRRYSSRACAGCGCLISPHDLILKARSFVYHLHCFNCTTCRRNLSQGERFSVDDETARLHCCVCWKHYDSIQNSFHHDYYDTMNDQQLKSNQRSTQYGVGEMQDVSGVVQVGASQKSKRMRTSFKHNQLRAMKSYFNINHNPDAKDLKQLAQETGLTKRVLQVWFQNARAKYRRSHSQKNDKLSKDEEQKQTSVQGDATKISTKKKSSDKKTWKPFQDSSQLDDLQLSPNETNSLSPISQTGSSPVQSRFCDVASTTPGSYSDLSSSSSAESNACSSEETPNPFEIVGYLPFGGDSSYPVQPNEYWPEKSYGLYSLDGDTDTATNGISSESNHKFQHSTNC